MKNDSSLLVLLTLAFANLLISASPLKRGDVPSMKLFREIAPKDPRILDAISRANVDGEGARTKNFATAKKSTIPKDFSSKDFKDVKITLKNQEHQIEQRQEHTKKLSESDLLTAAVAKKTSHFSDAELLTEEDASGHFRIAEMLQQYEGLTVNTDTSSRKLVDMSYGWYYTNLANGNECSAQPYHSTAYITNLCLSNPTSSLFIGCFDNYVNVTVYSDANCMVADRVETVPLGCFLKDDNSSITAGCSASPNVPVPPSTTVGYDVNLYYQDENCTSIAYSMVASIDEVCVATGTTSYMYDYPNQVVYTNSAQCEGPHYARLVYEPGCIPNTNENTTYYSQSYLANPPANGTMDGFVYFQYYDQLGCTGNKTATSGISTGTCIATDPESADTTSFQIILRGNNCSDATIQYFDDAFCQMYVGSAPIAVKFGPKAVAGMCTEILEGAFYASSELICTNSTLPPVDVPSVLTTFYVNTDVCGYAFNEFTSIATDMCLVDLVAANGTFDDYTPLAFTQSCNADQYVLVNYEGNVCNSWSPYNTTNDLGQCQYYYEFLNSTTDDNYYYAEAPTTSSRKLFIVSEDVKVSLVDNIPALANVNPVAEVLPPMALEDTMEPTVEPTEHILEPTLEPTMNTLEPSMEPTEYMTMAPTSILVCDMYYRSATYDANENYASCQFPLSKDQKAVVSGCGQYCFGDQVLRLFTASGQEVAYNDDSCGLCAKLTYVSPMEGQNMFVIRQGCFAFTTCGGQITITISHASDSEIEGETTSVVPPDGVIRNQCIIENTPFPSPPPTFSPSATPTEAPTTAPSATPTTAPSVRPTTAPTFVPTAVPTALPTTAVPTAIPTFAPTATPSTAAPSAAPTMVPTMQPTTNPTSPPNFPPTVAPSSGPNVVFEVIQMINGLTQESYYANEPVNSQVLMDTISSFMDGVDPEDIQDLTIVDARRLLSALADKLKIEVTTIRLQSDAVNANYKVVAYGTGLSYQSLTDQLNNAITSGAFTTTLNNNALAANSSALAHASSDTPATFIDLTPVTGDDDDNLSDGAIAGIVIGVIVFVLIVACIVAYFLYPEAFSEYMPKSSSHAFADLFPGSSKENGGASSGSESQASTPNKRSSGFFQDNVWRGGTPKQGNVPVKNAAEERGSSDSAASRKGASTFSKLGDNNNSSGPSSSANETAKTRFANVDIEL